MAWWTDHVLPRVIDRALSGAEVSALRRRACRGLSGAVVEIGFGSGPNVAHYPSAVRSVSAVEPSDVAWRLAQRRLDGMDVAAPEVIRAGHDGQRLDMPEASFDFALSTFSMCTIPDLDVALAELRRVVRPGGRLHFLEHGLSPDAAVARWQSRLHPLQRRVAGGCHLNRPIASSVTRSGWRIDTLEKFYARGPKPLAHLYLGRASHSPCEVEAAATH